MMKRRLMKYAMLYIADLIEDAFPDNEDMTTEKFIEMMHITFEYEETSDGHREDAILTILEHGEVEATFMSNIGR